MLIDTYEKPWKNDIGWVTFKSRGNYNMPIGHCAGYRFIYLLSVSQRRMYAYVFKAKQKMSMIINTDEYKFLKGNYGELC